MTIAEIIAAKKAAATAATPAPAPSAAAKPSDSMTDMLEAKAAIDRIDAPEKYQARKAASLILRAERSLSQTTGEGIDMTPAAADAETATWHAAMNGFESDLVVIRDPAEAEVCWLAVRPLRPGLPAILLHRLPWTIMEHPATIRPEDIPY
jgi:hypothetical protein